MRLFSLINLMEFLIRSLAYRKYGNLFFSVPTSTMITT